jgi:ribose 5-phosphate isomerase B
MEGKRMFVIYIGGDHGGFVLKEEMKEYLKERKECEIADLGAFSLEPLDDFPDYALAVAKKVSEKEGAKGILFCGSGQGMAIAANKVKGIRAAVCWDIASAKQSREHLDANILCLGAKFVSADLAKKIIDIWLDTPFLKEEKYSRRIRKI